MEGKNVDGKNAIAHTTKSPGRGESGGYGEAAGRSRGGYWGSDMAMAS